MWRISYTIIPDSKAIEDLHQRIPMKTKDRANEKITPSCCQHVVNTSDVIDSRFVGHPAAVNRYSFLDFFKKKKASEFDAKKLRLGNKHKLPKLFGCIMSSKGSWASVTEEDLIRSYAAWAWLSVSVGEGSPGIQI